MPATGDHIFGVEIKFVKFLQVAASANNKRKAGSGTGAGDQSTSGTNSNSDLQPPGGPQKKSCLTPTISVTYCQPQMTSLPSFAFSSLPQVSKKLYLIMVSMYPGMWKKWYPLILKML